MNSITHRAANLPLYRVPGESDFELRLDLTGYSPSGKHIEIRAESRSGVSRPTWRSSTADDSPVVTVAGSLVTISIPASRASEDDESFLFSALGDEIAYGVHFRESASDASDFVVQGDLDLLHDAGDFEESVAASTEVSLTIADGSTVNVEVLGVIEGEEGAVLSVNGRTGAVTLAASDVGLGNVENTADADKPISSATQSALDGKATTAQGAKADTALQPGDVVNDLTTGGAAVPGSAAQLVVLKGLIDNINTLLVSDETTLDTLQEIVDFIELNRADLDALGISSIAGLQSALDLKAASSHNHTLSDVTDAGTSASLDVPAVGDAAVGEVVKGDDSRLTDARTPASHTHTMSDITDAGGLATEDDVEGTAVKSTGETGGTKFLREDGDGTCSWQTIAGGGDMLASTYDPGSVSEQVVGLTATQTLTNKTLTSPTITLKQGTAPAPTAEGDIQWDTDDNQIKVGDGAATKVFSDDSQLATAAQGALADSAQQPPAEGAFVDGDKTKLDGIEASADVTDTANVTAAGALMDSEVTNLAQVKAFDSSDYATSAQGALADSAQQPPAEGAFVDGDKTKLDGIESGATAEPASVKAGEITIVINNPTAGVAGYHRIPKDYTINSASILASGSCSAVVDIWVDSITTDPTTDVTDADSITASAQPTLSSEVYSTDGTLTGWTTSLTEGHWMAWNVDSVSGAPDWIKVTLETTAA